MDLLRVFHRLRQLVGAADRLVVDGAMAYLHQRGRLRAFDRMAYGEANDEVVRASAEIKNAKKNPSNIRKRIPSNRQRTDV